jgi:hypothetical protein
MSKLTNIVSESAEEPAFGIVSGPELAELWACSDRLVRQLADEGIAVRAGHGKYDADQSTRRYIRHLRTEIVHRHMGVHSR